ncbi:MAG: hypothetical protein K6U02_03930 [Firmicutes bacterium]|nr:hypothetical protein [Bacillota bacterium]
MRRARNIAALIVGVFFILPGTTAQPYRAETFSAAAPDEVSAAMREVLSENAIRIFSEKGTLCEVWVVRTIPVRTHPSPQLGVILPELEEGTLIGVVRFRTEGEDYRRQVVSPGVYTMRYALHPVDGNHQGVAPQRDFLLLVPASADGDPGLMPPAELYTQSQKASGTTHPSVWSLVPAEAVEAAALPAVTHHPGEDLWIVTFLVPAQAERAAPRPLPISLVFAGHAPEA